jgi:hypothetical protein
MNERNVHITMADLLHSIYSKRKHLGKWLYCTKILREGEKGLEFGPDVRSYTLHERAFNGLHLLFYTDQVVNSIIPRSKEIYKKVLNKKTVRLSVGAYICCR